MGGPGLELAPRSQALFDRTRWVAAVLGFGLAAVTIGAGYAISEIPAVERIFSFRLLFETGGLFVTTQAHQAAALLSGPLAAGVSGWLAGRRAASGDRWAGLWMGAGTFTLAIALAWVVLTPPDLVSMIAGLPFIPFVASIVFAPLLVLCVLAGIAWAAAVRSVAGSTAPVSGTRLPPSFLLALIALALMAWAAGMLMVIGLGEAPADLID